MLATLVRAQLVAELLLYIALGFWLRAAQGWSVPALVAAAIVAGLAARALIVCASTAISFFARSPRTPEQRLGLRGTAGLLVGEWRAMLADNLWFLPWESRVVRPDPPPLRDAGVPVLLVHGYLSNRGLMHGLIRALEDAGAPQVFTFNFRGVFAPIDALVGQLDGQVRRVAEATGQARVVLVCHSMGGLVARAWLAKHGPHRVARLVTIASPHNGTALARLGLGANARQMGRESAFLRDLRAGEAERGPGCEATSIYSMHDNLVAPQETSRLPWAKNVAVVGIGHVEILNAGPVHRLVVEALRDSGVSLRD
jgi:triacylglycerol esterase/lipase EstA (alpha/beta hydrolase family)